MIKKTAADKNTIYKFLNLQPLAVISTIAADSDQPESALIAFAETENLEIIFESFIDTRKWRNLRSNPRIALSTGWDRKKHITLQYEGVAAPIPTSETEQYIALFLAKDTPCTEKFLYDPRIQLYKISPIWIRYSDYTHDSPKIIELDFS